jgi:hypothetical protein
VKLINTLQITQKKRYDREMGSSEVMVEKFSRQQAKTDSVEEAGLRSLIDAEAGKRAAWALLIMWALHRKSPSHNLRPSTNWRDTSRRLLEGVGAYLAKETVSVAKKQCNIPKRNSVLHLAILYGIWGISIKFTSSERQLACTFSSG